MAKKRRRKVVITTPFPSFAATAKRLGVSKKRLEWIKRQAAQADKK
ncbi:hypothetical protein KGO95_04275 [Patescibacteria group bacterium]|nr:hypothetical protein [Patescibacteria group bacterium]